MRIPLKDDAIVSERGVEWFYPVNQRMLLIKQLRAAGYAAERPHDVSGV